MNMFVKSIGNELTTTINGMTAYESSLDSCVDFFFKVGASRGQNIVPLFVKAYVENPDLALRIAQWARDVRGGAGERRIYRDILLHLEKHEPLAAKALASKTPEVGRWDDLLVFNYPELRKVAFSMIATALKAGNGLVAKWMPRKGKEAAELRKFLGMSPKQYRKTLVNLTNVVETKMCAKDWNSIEFGKLPSLASARYKKAFIRNAAEAYAKYAERLSKGEEKINANAVYPYDVLKGVINYNFRNAYGPTELAVIDAQWKALPDYMNGENVLALVDVSGSMCCPVGSGHAANRHTLTCLDVAVSLGLYVADKNKGAFKDTFLTFSRTPELLNLKGNILDKASQMSQSNWASSTDIDAAFKKILSHAVANKVPAEDMPTMLLVMSDMQFNYAGKYSADKLVAKRFADAGYAMPRVVWWNINAYDNVPCRADENGMALVSGFSPSILKSILANSDFEEFTPRSIMLETVMVDRYALPLVYAEQ